MEGERIGRNFLAVSIRKEFNYAKQALDILQDP